MNKKDYIRISFSTLLIIFSLVFGVVSFNKLLYSYTEEDTKEQTQDITPYQWIQIFNDVLLRIKQDYVIDIPTSKLIEASINGMEKILDPHTNFFEEKEYKDLMIHTKGEFGGLGIIISIRNKVLTVISPLPGTPAEKAGIQAGDQILYIEDKPTKGMSLEEAVNILRGPKGSKVTIKVKREGVPGLLTFTITRDIIKIKSVPYYTLLENGYGYIKLVSFSKNTTQELKKAIRELEKSNGGELKGIILDLRNNPGGLLSQAISVGNVFLDKGKVIVSVKGRKGDKRDFTATERAFLDDNVRVVVLVNEGSASASEIVSGAIQDWDRGVILGRRTYGKGSVQTIIPLMKTPTGTKALKLTTAYYYTPSGRCINRIENSAGYELYKEGDSTIANLEIFDTTKVYYTKVLHRPVKAGGGILPDLILPERDIDLLEVNLEAKSMFFTYAINYKAKHEKVSKDIEITDDILKDFREFLKSKNFTYTTREEAKLKELILKTLEYNIGEKVYNEKLDTLSLEVLLSKVDSIDSDMGKIYKELYKKIEERKEMAFEKDKEYIKRAIKREILNAYYGQEGKYEYLTKVDEEIRKALQIIKSDDYKKILTKNAKIDGKKK